MIEEFHYLREQNTLATSIAFIGRGLHGGAGTTMRVLPAAAGCGIVFVRRDLPDGENRFEARWNTVGSTEMCVALVNRHGNYVMAVEHLMAAFGALGIDNATVLLDGSELPVLDGSSLPFVESIRAAGVAPLGVSRDLIVIRRPMRLRQGTRWAELLPCTAPRITLTIDFPEKAIGTQWISLAPSANTFCQDIAAARTFGFAEDLPQLRRRGFALGSSLQNTVLLERGKVRSGANLRFADELVRHAALDVIGDLTLARAPIVGHYRANRPSHCLNNDLLRLLMRDGTGWQRIDATAFLDGTSGGMRRGLNGSPDVRIDREVDAGIERMEPAPGVLRRLFSRSARD